MKNKVIGIVIVLMIIMLIIPNTAFCAKYGGIYTDVQIGSTPQAKSSAAMTGRILGTLQVAGTVISVVALIIIGMRYMFSSVEERSQIKGVLLYYLIGAILVLCVSNVVAFAYDIINGLK